MQWAGVAVAAGGSTVHQMHRVQCKHLYFPALYLNSDPRWPECITNGSRLNVRALVLWLTKPRSPQNSVKHMFLLHENIRGGMFLNLSSKIWLFPRLHNYCPVSAIARKITDLIPLSNWNWAGGSPPISGHLEGTHVMQMKNETCRFYDFNSSKLEGKRPPWKYQ